MLVHTAPTPMDSQQCQRQFVGPNGELDTERLVQYIQSHVLEQQSDAHEFSAKVIQLALNNYSSCFAEQLNYIDRTTPLKSAILMLPFEKYYAQLPHVAVLHDKGLARCDIDVVKSNSTSIYMKCLYYLYNQDVSVLKSVQEGLIQFHEGSDQALFADLTNMAVNSVKSQLLGTFTTLSSEVVVTIRLISEQLGYDVQFVKRVVKSMQLSTFTQDHNYQLFMRVVFSGERAQGQLIELLADEQLYREHFAERMQVHDLLRMYDLDYRTRGRINESLLLYTRQSIPQSGTRQHVYDLCRLLRKLKNEPFKRLVECLDDQQQLYLLRDSQVRRRAIFGGVINKAILFKAHHGQESQLNRVVGKIEAVHQPHQQSNRAFGKLFSRAASKGIQWTIVTGVDYSETLNGQFLFLNFTVADSNNQDGHISFTKLSDKTITVQCGRHHQDVDILGKKNVQLCIQIFNKQVAVFEDRRLLLQRAVRINDELRHVVLSGMAVYYFTFTPQLLPMCSLPTFEEGCIRRRPIFDYKTCNCISKVYYSSVGFAIPESIVHDGMNDEGQSQVSVEDYAITGMGQLKDVNGRVRINGTSQLALVLGQQVNRGERLIDEIVQMINYYGERSINVLQLAVARFSESPQDAIIETSSRRYRICTVSERISCPNKALSKQEELGVVMERILERAPEPDPTIFGKVRHVKLKLGYLSLYKDAVLCNRKLQQELYNYDPTLYNNVIDVDILLRKYHQNIVDESKRYINYYLSNSLLKNRIFTSIGVLGQPNQDDMAPLLALFILTSGPDYSVNKEMMLNVMDCARQIFNCGEPGLHAAEQAFLQDLIDNILFVIGQLLQNARSDEAGRPPGGSPTAHDVIAIIRGLAASEGHTRRRLLFCLKTVYRLLEFLQIGSIQPAALIRYFTGVWDLVQSQYPSDAPFLYGAAAVHNLKLQTFRWLDANYDEASIYIVSQDNIILDILLLEHILHASCQEAISYGVLERLFYALCRYEQNSLFQAHQGHVEALVKSGVFSIPLPAMWQHDRLLVCLLICCYQIGYNQYVAAGGGDNSIKCYLLIIKYLIRNPVYQQILYAIEQSPCSAVSQFVHLVAKVNMVIIGDKIPTYLGRAQLSEQQRQYVIEKSTSISQCVKNIHSVMIDMNLALLGLLDGVELELQILSYMYNCAGIQRQRDAIVGLHIRHLKRVFNKSAQDWQATLNSASSGDIAECLTLDKCISVINYYNSTQDALLALLNGRKSRINLFQSGYNQMKASLIEYGLKKSSDESLPLACFLLYFAYGLDEARQAQVFLKMYIAQYPLQFAAVCLQAPTINEADQLKRAIELALAGDNSQLMCIMQKSAGIGQYIKDSTRQVLETHRKQHTTVPGASSQIAEIMKNIMGQQKLLRQSQLATDTHQCSNITLLDFSQKHIDQYFASTATALCEKLVQHQVRRHDYEQIYRSRIALREQQCRLRCNQQILARLPDVGEINTLCHQFIEGLTKGHKIHASIFIPVSQQIIMAIDVNYSIMSNLSNQCGILVFSQDYITYVPHAMISASEAGELSVTVGQDTNFNNQLCLSPQNDRCRGGFSEDRIVSPHFYMNCDPELQFLEDGMSKIMGQLFRIKVKNIISVQPRQFVHRESSFEIFCSNGYSFNFDVIDRYVVYMVINQHSNYTPSCAHDNLNAEVIRGLAFGVLANRYNIHINGFYLKSDIVRFLRQRGIDQFSYFGDVLVLPESVSDGKLCEVLERSLDQPVQAYVQVYKNYYAQLFHDYIVVDSISVPALEPLPHGRLLPAGRQLAESIQRQQQCDNIQQAMVKVLLDLYCSDAISAKQLISYINTLSGRSVNDLSVYPIYPIVKGRVMSMPVQAQRAERTTLLEQRQRSILEMMDKGCIPGSARAAFRTDMYMNGTFCSNSASTTYYLFRQQPYTSALIDLQGGRFDAPDRMYHSYRCLYGAIFDTNYKEHILQLFSSIKVHLNLFGLSIGQRTCGKSIGDLDFDGGDGLDYAEAPQHGGAAHNSLQLLYEINKALSVVGRKEMYSWLQLFFGSLQNSEQRYNVYPTYSYYCKVTDSELVSQEIDKIRYFGCMTSNVFVNKNKLFQSLTNEQLVEQSVSQGLASGCGRPEELVPQSNQSGPSEFTFYKQRINFNRIQYIINKAVYNRRGQNVFDVISASHEEALLHISSTTAAMVGEFHIKFYIVSRGKGSVGFAGTVYFSKYVQAVKVYDERYIVVSFLDEIQVLQLLLWPQQGGQFAGTAVRRREQLLFDKVYASTVSTSSGYLYVVADVRSNTAIVVHDLLNRQLVNRIWLQPLMGRTVQEVSLQVNQDEFLFVLADEELLVFTNEQINVLQQQLGVRQFVCTRSLFGAGDVVLVGLRGRDVVFYGVDETSLETQTDDCSLAAENTVPDTDMATLEIIGCQLERANCEPLIGPVLSRELVRYGAMRLVEVGAVRFHTEPRQVLVGALDEVNVELHDGSWCTWHRSW